MLNTERNTHAMSKRIERAAKKHFRTTNLSTHFEHGQWWILMNNGAQYSVCDAEGIGTTDGFDFEQITEADEY